LTNFRKQSTQQREKRKTNKEDPSSSQKHKKIKRVTKGQRNKLCFKVLTKCNKHIRERKGKEN
jgi:hypothetical protein